MFFYTERLPAYDLFKGHTEAQKLARPDHGMLQAVGTETVISLRPEGDGVEHDFRDHKVWWDEAVGACRMVLGAALHGDPAVLLYGSGNLVDWTYLGPMYRAPAHYRDHGARAVECPDFSRLAAGGSWCHSTCASTVTSRARASSRDAAQLHQRCSGQSRRDLHGAVCAVHAASGCESLAFDDHKLPDRERWQFGRGEISIDLHVHVDQPSQCVGVGDADARWARA